MGASLHELYVVMYQIRMVAGFAEVIESGATVVAEGRFELVTFGL